MKKFIEYDNVWSDILNKNSFIYGSIILAIVNFIVRFIGFSYKIILSRLIGPEGIGLFQMTFPVLMVFVTITTAGVPVAVSKLVSKKNSINKGLEAFAIFKISFYFTLLISLLFAIIIILTGKFISFNLLKNKSLLYNIYFLAPAIVIISISSVMRGYFYGLKQIKSAGLAQIIEQLTRIIFVIGIIYYLYPIDTKLGALIAVCGISIGELLGFIWLYSNYRLLKSKEKLKLTNNFNILQTLNQIFFIAIPITVSRVINVSLQLINAAMIPQRLMVAGYPNSEAVAIFGRVTGMTMPLIFLPFIFTSAMVVNIIPNLSEDIELKRYNTIRNKIGMAIRITFLIAIPLTFVYVFFPEPIAMFLYGDKLIASYLGALGYSTIFLSFQHILSGILHGLGKQVIATVNYAIGMSIQLILTYLLVSNPSIGIRGFFIGFILATIIISILNFYSVNKAVKINIKTPNFVFKPILASIFMIIGILFIYEGCNCINANEFIRLFASIFSGVLIYLFVLFITKGLKLSWLKKIF